MEDEVTKIVKTDRQVERIGAVISLPSSLATETNIKRECIKAMSDTIADNIIILPVKDKQQPQGNSYIEESYKAELWVIKGGKDD